MIALEKTPDQLDVLGDAGVVDAGGRGLLVLLDALRSTITGQAPNRKVYEPAPRRPVPEIAAQPKAPQFEVMYLLGGCDTERADLLRERLDELGESVAIATSGVVGGYSVHVHTDDAGAAIEAGLADRATEARRQARALLTPPPPTGCQTRRGTIESCT